MSREISEAVKSFIVARKADGRAPRTIKDYHRVLEPFAKWCRQRELAVSSLGPEHIREYVAGLRSRGWARGTVAIHIRNLRSFLRWLHDEGYTKVNLAKAIKPPKRVLQANDIPTIEEIVRLLDACRGDRFALRDRAMILVLIDTGLRLGEMARLRREQIHFGETSTWIEVFAPKTQTFRHAFLGEVATAALRKYLSTREDDNPAVWMGRRGPLTEQGIYRAIYRRVKAANLNPRRVHPHAFRRFFATKWIEGGGDETRLRKIGGWSSPEMLEVYVALARREDLGRAHQIYGPVDRLLDPKERYKE